MTLYIVATPIGNRSDITQRALEILQSVDLIAAEHIRHSRSLLSHYRITGDFCAYHQHNESQMVPKLITKLQEGKSIALITDSGTPLINDPGYELVLKAHENNIRVVPIPGPSALITALVASGLPVNKFIFEGYLPSHSGLRRRTLSDLAMESRTIVFYEAPHRIQQTIADMCDTFGYHRKTSIARELTKKFEQIVYDTLGAIHLKFNEHIIQLKGEFVIVVEGAHRSDKDDFECLRICQILLEKLSPSDVASLVARLSGRDKKSIYKLIQDRLR